MNWTPARVGCYWTSGDFHISTYARCENGVQVFTFPKSGYSLTRNFEELGRFETLQEAQNAASKEHAA